MAEPVFILGFLLAVFNAGCGFPTAEQAKRRNEANGSPPGVQETMRSDRLGSGRRGYRDNVATRVSRELDWSDRAGFLQSVLFRAGFCRRENRFLVDARFMTETDARFPRPELPKKEVPGARSPWWTLWAG